MQKISKLKFLLEPLIETRNRCKISPMLFMRTIVSISKVLYRLNSISTVQQIEDSKRSPGTMSMMEYCLGLVLSISNSNKLYHNCKK